MTASSAARTLAIDLFGFCVTGSLKVRLYQAKLSATSTSEEHVSARLMALSLGRKAAIRDLSSVGISMKADDAADIRGLSLIGDMVSRYLVIVDIVERRMADEKSLRPAPNEGHPRQPETSSNCLNRQADLQPSQPP